MKKIHLLLLLSHFTVLFAISRMDSLRVLNQLNAQSTQLEEIEQDRIVRLSYPKIDTIFMSPTLLTKEDSTLNKYYGYSLINNRSNLIVWDDVIPSKDYILGSGDELLIKIWGDTQLDISVKIDKRGAVFIDKIGLVNIANQSLSQAANFLKAKFSKVYSTVSGSNPTSFIDVTIGEVKSINVTFLGEVNSPGLHVLHPFSSILTGLYQVGGVNKSGSLRNIEILRNGEKFHSFDLYKYINGDYEQNEITLHDNDIVFIPIVDTRVKLEGEVSREGYFELKENETISDLLKYVGRIKTDKKNYSILEKMPSANALDDLVIFIPDSKYGEYELKDGDKLTLLTLLNVKRRVAIYGKVKKEGEFPFYNGMKILDLFQLAVDIHDSTFLKSIDLKNAQLIRRDEKNEYPKAIEVSLKEILQDANSNQNLLLENTDLLLIFENSNFDVPDKVEVIGEVYRPGIYTVQKNGEDVSSFIQRAGGPTSKAFLDGVHVSRDSSLIVLSDLEFELLNNDKIIIPRKIGVVSVRGEILKEGKVQFKRDKPLSYYIEKAGGFSNYADKSKIAVIYPNGNVKIKKWHSTPSIINGSTIIIYPEEYREPVKLTEVAKNISSLVASLATILVLVNQ